MRAMRIGPHHIEPEVILAPMAGVTDKPFRVLCKRLGAGLAMSEMTTSDPRFWQTAKSLRRMDHAGEPDPISVQIVRSAAAASPICRKLRCKRPTTSSRDDENITCALGAPWVTPIAT